MSATNGTHHEAAPAASAETPSPSKDEIGWYFVESYYTTLSKTPEKLHLFYNSRSQYVTGDEAKISPVSVGRAAIKERIASIDFHDCKVRVSNVDSQSSDNDMIVVQVIGEISNKTSELKKFVQTFVLAKQPGGYYVLNDIFRYIIDEAEEEATGAAPVQDEAAPVEAVAEKVEEPETETLEEPQVPQIDADAVDKKLEQDQEPAVLKTPEVNGEAETTQPEKEATPEVEEPVVAEKEVEKETLVPEVPQDPTPTPVVAKSPPKQAPAVPAAPAAPAAPAKPMSWASRAAAAAVAVPRPVVPAVPAPKAAGPARAPAPATTPAAKAAAPSPPVKKENEAPQSQGWQTAGADAKRQNRPQSMSAPAEKEGTMAYVRNVIESVDAEALKETLSKFGELVYFDVNRQKNCAFVEYSTPVGYQAAFAANPHKVSGESIIVEPRKPKTPYGGFNNNRGGMNNRGRGGFQNRGPGGPNRGNFGGAPRGGAQQQRGPRPPTAAAPAAQTA